MIKFLVYLFESGICMLILYLVYWFFLRKETYFTFIRLYLVGSVFLVLLVPFIHVNISIPGNDSLREPAVKIIQFRDYYEELIAMTDPYYRVHEPVDQSTMSDYDPETGQIHGPPAPLNDGYYSGVETVFERPATVSFSSRIVSPAGIILLIYFGGVFYFICRFIYLCMRLFLITRKNEIIRKNGFRLVNLRGDFSPFSFFSYVFINLDSVSAREMENILAHEHVHVQQQHTLDHLLAQGLAVFQWFNPFAWQIRNALKTTHEYIADKGVLDQGFRLFDYQSLLLRQVITYHSVELVNNFNLKPIKKRIAMMTKNRSGISAKLKALFIIPFALLVFVLFAEFTITGPDKTKYSLRSEINTSKTAQELIGLWKSDSKEFYGNLVSFDSEKIYVLESSGTTREFYYQVDKNLLRLAPVPVKLSESKVFLKFLLDGNNLTLWWSNDESRVYSKTKYHNSMDLVLGKTGFNIELPVISRYRIMEDQAKVYNLFLGYSKGPGEEPVLILQNGKVSFEEFPKKLNEVRNTFNILDYPYLTALFHVDKNMKMEWVSKIRQMMRENDALKLADAGIPYDEDVSPVIRHSVALPRLLPPMDAKFIEEEELPKEGIGLYKLNLAERNITPAEVDRELKAFINNNKKFVMVLEFDNQTPYGEYMEAVDIIFNAIYDLREQQAIDQFNIPYEDLGPAQQKEIKKIYPVTLTEKNIDQD
jgi:biopolymer transport protein ExbD